MRRLHPVVVEFPPQGYRGWSRCRCRYRYGRRCRYHCSQFARVRRLVRIRYIMHLIRGEIPTLAMAVLAVFHPVEVPFVCRCRVYRVQDGMGVGALAVIAGHTRQPGWLCLQCPGCISAMTFLTVPDILREYDLIKDVRVAGIYLLWEFQVPHKVNAVHSSGYWYCAITAPSIQGSSA